MKKRHDFSEGPEDAAVMLIGQNPGREEARQKRPFVGRAGKYLDRVLAENRLVRNRLYLTSMVKEPTPQNRQPTAREIDRWLPVLESEIRDINPKIVVLMGRVAWKAPRLEGIEYIETYHPAAAMRFPRIREKFVRDMAELSGKIQ